MRFFRVMTLMVVAMLCLNVNAQPRQAHNQQPVKEHKQEVKKESHKGSVAKGFRTTTAVKLRKHAANNSSSVKNRKGQGVVIPKGAAITYVGSKGNYYKVSYNGYTGYVAKKYTTGRNATSAKPK